MSLDGAVDHLLQPEHFVDDLLDVHRLLAHHYLHQAVDPLLKWSQGVPLLACEL